MRLKRPSAAPERIANNVYKGESSMFNILVTIDRSLESSFALRTACLFKTRLRIQPIYVFEPPGRDLAFGAGWARKSWERETNRQAEETIEDLVQAERGQCPDIQTPVVLTGDPIQEPAEYFWSGQFDLLVVGAPFRGWEPLPLSRRFGQAALKARRQLPLMVVRHLKEIKQIVAFTDGGDVAENALGLLLRIQPFLGGQITVVGMSRDKKNASSVEALNMERGMAILKEGGIEATGHSASLLGSERLTAMAKAADLVVNPVSRKDPLHHYYDLHDDEHQAVLLCLNGR
jgi:hypothetical protein